MLYSRSGRLTKSIPKSVLAQSGHSKCSGECPLLGGKADIVQPSGNVCF